MKLKQLRLFNEIYVTGSLTTAAGRLFISQPAASKILANFEHDVGYKLFHRKNGKLQATPEANLLHEEVLSALQHMNQLEDSFRRAGRGARGEIKITSILGPALGYLPDLIRRFQLEHEEAHIILATGTSLPIREMVATAKIDIGIADIGLQSNRYDMTAVTMRCNCALHTSHPLANQPFVTPLLLGAINWITYGSEHETTTQLKAIYKEQRIAFQSNLTVHSTIMGLGMVEMNMGAAIIDSMSSNHFQRNIGIQFPNVKLVPFKPRVLETVDIISQNSRPMSNLTTLFLSKLLTEIEEFDNIR